MTTVLGIDPSLTGTGIAFIDGYGHVTDLLTIKTKPTTDDIASRLARFEHILGEFGSAIDYADLVVIEQPAYSSRTGKQHDRSGLWWAIANAVIHRCEKPLVEVTPSARATYATGKGNAGKDTVIANVVRRYPNVDVQDNNQADALVLAAMGARHLGTPIEESLPQSHLRALEKVAWPVDVQGVAGAQGVA